MPHEYSAQNHDWDLTLSSAHELLAIGAVQDKLPRTGNITKGFSALTGSMLLSFCAIESFSASVAFCMPSSEKFSDFPYGKYRKTRNFWGKLELIFAAVDRKIDRSMGLFQGISNMQSWRNLVTHASPYRIEPTPVLNTTSEPSKLHVPFHAKDYAKQVDLQTAKQFYTNAFDYIHLLKRLSNLEPRAQAVFKIGADTH